jgi:hypothetical protein
VIDPQLLKLKLVCSLLPTQYLAGRHARMSPRNAGLFPCVIGCYVWSRHQMSLDFAHSSSDSASSDARSNWTDVVARSDQTDISGSIRRRNGRVIRGAREAGNNRVGGSGRGRGRSQIVARTDGPIVIGHCRIAGVKGWFFGGVGRRSSSVCPRLRRKLRPRRPAAIQATGRASEPATH